MSKHEIQHLFTVKSLITIIFSVGYTIMAIMGKVDSDDFNYIMTIIITFYFAHKCNQNKEEYKK